MNKPTATFTIARHFLAIATASTLLMTSMHAQTNALGAPSATPGAPAGSPFPQVALPAEFSDLGLTNVQSRYHIGPRGDARTHFYGYLPNGGRLLAETQDGRLLKVKTDQAPMPNALVERMLSPALRSSAALAGLAHIIEINLEDPKTRSIKVKILAANGQQQNLFFNPTGELVRSEPQPENELPSDLVETTRKLLQGLGYTDVHFIHRTPKHTKALATNPYGELVEVSLNHSGEVTRESFWLK